MHFMQQHTYIHSILLSYQAKSPTIIHKTNDLENKMCGSFQSSGASTYLSSGVPTTPLFSSSSQMSNSDFPFCWLEAEFTRKLLCPPLFFASFIFLARLTKASTLAHFPSMQLASFLHSLLDRQPTGTLFTKAIFKSQSKQKIDFELPRCCERKEFGNFYQKLSKNLSLPRERN